MTVTHPSLDVAAVRADFNDPLAVVHYTRAAHFLGLWKSELSLIERFLPDRAAPLLEAGCGSGRVTLGLWDLGFRRITAFDVSDVLFQFDSRGQLNGLGLWLRSFRKTSRNEEGEQEEQ